MNRTRSSARGAWVVAALAWFFGNRHLAAPFSRLVAVTKTLRQRDAELEEAQRLAHIGNWTWDPRSDTFTASDESLRIFGFDPAKEFLPPLREQRGRCYPAEEWERLQAAMQESLRTGVGYELDLHAMRDGQRIWVTTRSEIVCDAQGQIVGLRGTVQDITERKRSEMDLLDSHQEKVALLKEVHHRVKNNLQIVVSLLGLEANRTESRQGLDVLMDTRNRVRSMALLHEVVYRSGSLARISFATYLGDLCRQIAASFGHAAERIGVEHRVEDIGLPLDKAVPCGLIVNELICNAFNHAFPGDRSGSVLVELSRIPGNMLHLRVHDDGVGLPPDITPESASTLGLQLVFDLSCQLLGHVTLDRPIEGGTAFAVVFSFDENRHRGDLL